MTDETACKGSQVFADHAMVELGRCPHEVGDATYVYLESACPDCGGTARQTVIFGCRTGRKAVRPTAENCLTLKWKADRKEGVTSTP